MNSSKDILGFVATEAVQAISTPDPFMKTHDPTPAPKPNPPTGGNPLLAFAEYMLGWCRDGLFIKPKELLEIEKRANEAIAASAPCELVSTTTVNAVLAKQRAEAETRLAEVTAEARQLAAENKRLLLSCHDMTKERDGVMEALQGTMISIATDLQHGKFIECDKWFHDRKRGHYECMSIVGETIRQLTDARTSLASVTAERDEARKLVDVWSHSGIRKLLTDAVPSASMQSTLNQCVVHCLRELTASRDAALARVGQWLPIETAPKDGTRVIVAGRSGMVGEASFSESEDCWFWEDSDKTVIPTHWQPLPQPPTTPSA